VTTNSRVLVVEDDPDVRGMIVEYLSGHGFDMAQAENGAAMRAAITARVPDAVLLDVNLGGEDGISLARWLRERHDIGIIMVTAAGEVVDRVVGRSTFTWRVMKQSFLSVLELRRRRSELGPP